MQLNFLPLILLLFCGCQTGIVVLNVKVTDSPTPVKVKILGEFTETDYKNAAKSLELIKYLFPDLVFTNKPTMFWMDSKEFDGLTIGKVNKFIVIDKYFKFPLNKAVRNEDYFKLGSCISHEMSHCERNLNENDTQALTDRRLLQILFTEPDKVRLWQPTFERSH